MCHSVGHSFSGRVTKARCLQFYVYSFIFNCSSDMHILFAWGYFTMPKCIQYTRVNYRVKHIMQTQQHILAHCVD